MYKVTLNDEHWFLRNLSTNSTSEMEPVFLENVGSYSYNDFTSIEVITVTKPQSISINSILHDSTKDLYCVMDSPHSHNFGHFFWESFVFLPYFKRLLSRFPNIIFITGDEKRFKDKILQSYGFRFASKIRSLNNIVAFMPPITALVTNKYTSVYCKALDEFHYEIQRDRVPFEEKDIQVSYFPRHKAIDNTLYEGQNRNFYVPQIADFVKSRADCVLFDTEHSSCWEKEIDCVRRSKFMICHDGASVSVLGFHAHQTTIIALSDNVSIPSLRRFDKAAYLANKIASINEFFYVSAPNSEFTLASILPILTNQIVAYPFFRNI
jgi:hypothetical protein